MIDESYRWFVGLVEDRRKIKVADIPGLQSGRIFSGREALQHKLVDQIGGEPVFSALVAHFYAAVKEDPVLRPPAGQRLAQPLLALRAGRLHDVLAVLGQGQ